MALLSNAGCPAARAGHPAQKPVWVCRPSVSAQRSLVGLAVLGEDGLRLLVEGGRHAVFLDHALKLRLHGSAERIDVDLVERAALLLLELAPAEYITVSLKNTVFGGMSDGDGNFEFAAPPRVGKFRMIGKSRSYGSAGTK